MKIIKNAEQREVEQLQKVENGIERHERRERIHHLLIAGLSVLSVLAFIGGHLCGSHCEHKHRRFI